MPQKAVKGGELPRIAILISGQGSNMEVILKKIREGLLRLQPVFVFSDVKTARGLQIAESMGIPTHTFSPRDFESFREYESRLVELLRRENVEWIICAGYMRLLKKQILEAYKNRIINIHPSLLPAFPGLDAQKQALDYGVKIAGCTVHYVDEGVDTGKVIMQTAVKVEEDDTVEELSARIRIAEHDTFWRAIHLAIFGVLP